MLALALTGLVLTGWSADPDLVPPDWRGDPGSTLQQWSFSTDADPATPDIFSNPFGSSSADIDVEPLYGTGWWDTYEDVYGSKQGWWDVARGSITLEISNSPSSPPGSYKLIQVQVTYWRDISAAPSISVNPFATQQGSTITTLIENGPEGGAWYSDRSIWVLGPNPSSETVLVQGHATYGSMIDGIVVDTICVVPEPSSVACAALLGLAALWRVRFGRV